MRLSPFHNVCEKRILFTPQYFDPLERAILAERYLPTWCSSTSAPMSGPMPFSSRGKAGPAARVLAIEPQPMIFERLVYNIAQNPDAKIKAIGCAVADRDGDMTLFVDTTIAARAASRSWAGAGEAGQSVKVPARIYAHVAVAAEEGLERIDALKVDVGAGGSGAAAIPARCAGFICCRG
jgi:FkbM family methyltransferase